MHLTLQYPVVDINTKEKCNYFTEEERIFYLLTTFQLSADINYLQSNAILLKTMSVFSFFFFAHAQQKKCIYLQNKYLIVGINTFH